MQGDGNPTQRQRVTLGVDETYLLFVDLPGVDRSLQFARAYHGSLQLAVPARARLHTRRPRWPASAADPTRPESGQAKEPPTYDAVLQGDGHWRRDDSHRGSWPGTRAPEGAPPPAAHQSPGRLAGPHHVPARPTRATPPGAICHKWLGPRCRAGPPALDRRHARWAGHQGQPVPSDPPQTKPATPAYTALRRCVPTTHRSFRH